MQGFYDRVIFPRLMHFTMGFREVSEYRSRVVPGATGRVLEIGLGSGLNLPFYGDRVTEVIGIDPHETLNRMAGRRLGGSRPPVRIVNASAEALPMDDASVDCVVTTWTLCSIAGVDRALQEVRRVLRPGGEILFIEHGSAPDAAVARWQDRLTPVWRRCAGGCHLNRPIDQLIARAGFTITELETGYLKGPRLLSFCYWGRAKP